MSAATKPSQQKTNVQCFFKVISPTQHGWQVLDDHLAYDQAEILAEENSGSFVRFSSYSVQRIGTRLPEEQQELSAENSHVVPVFDVLEVTEFAIETIGSGLEYSEALHLQESRRVAVVQAAGYRRVPLARDQVEYQKPREKAAVYNRAEAITFRLFLMPLATVILLAVLVTLKKLGVL